MAWKRSSVRSRSGPPNNPSQIKQLSTIDTLTDDKLIGFAIRLALAGHRGITREGEFDFLAEAETVFMPPPPVERQKPNKAKKSALIKATSELVKKVPEKKPRPSKNKIDA